MTITHHTAPTQRLEVNGIHFSYRRFGRPGATPLVLNHQYTATMDHWDPALIDALALEREIILFNNAGVSGSTGLVPDSVEQMAANAGAFIRALGLSLVDVLGFSLGGMVAQEIALQAPDLVRKLILIGTGPKGGEGMENFSPEAQAVFKLTFTDPDEIWLALNFHESETSQSAGKAWLQRFGLRQQDRDPSVGEQAVQAQATALLKWGEKTAAGYAYLNQIRQPTLILAGGKDHVIYPVNAFILQQNLADGQLIIYPDASHGPHHQYPDVAARHMLMFLANS